MRCGWKWGRGGRVGGGGIFCEAADLFSEDALADAVLSQLVLDLLGELDGVHLLVHVDLVLLGRERGHGRLGGLAQGQQGGRGGQGAALGGLAAGGAREAQLRALRAGRLGTGPVLPVVQRG